MPLFKLHLRRGSLVEADEFGLEARDLHHAYLEACRAVPDTAREELIEGRDPMACAFLICDASGQRLFDVPFTEVLSPAQALQRRAKCRPHAGPRSARARDDLALASFRRMFSAPNVGCVLMTPELQVREMNDYGARHSHVDSEAIRDRSISDIFDLAGAPKENFGKFMRLAQAGVVSGIVDMPYLVLDGQGATMSGWWNARTWPIDDDDDRLLGLVEWAEPSTRPSNRGLTFLRTGSGAEG